MLAISVLLYGWIVGLLMDVALGITSPVLFWAEGAFTGIVFFIVIAQTKKIM